MTEQIFTFLTADEERELTLLTEKLMGGINLTNEEVNKLRNFNLRKTEYLKATIELTGNLTDKQRQN